MDVSFLSDFSGTRNLRTAQATRVTKKTMEFNSSVKLLLVFAVGLVAWFSWKPSLYDQYKINDSIIVEQLAKSQNVDFRTASNHLANGNYEETRKILSKYYLANSSDVNLAKQYAAILISSDDLEGSKQVLYQIFAKNSLNDKADAAYLLGLIFLKEGKIKISQSWLSKVSAQSAYYQQSQELISKINGQIEK